MTIRGFLYVTFLCKRYISFNSSFVKFNMYYLILSSSTCQTSFRIIFRAYYCFIVVEEVVEKHQKKHRAKFENLVLCLWLRRQDRQAHSLSNSPPDCSPNQLRPAGLLLGNSFAGSSLFYHNYKKTDTETASVFLWLRGQDSNLRPIDYEKALDK